VIDEGPFSDDKPLIFLISSGSLTDENFLDSSVHLVGKFSEAARSGVDFIQIREKKISAMNLLELVRRVVSEISDTHCRVVVNERFDVAIVAGAHGVHLTSTSIPAEIVRSNVPDGFIIGKSAHSISEIENAKKSVDYLFFGPIFDTPSKIGIIESKGVEELKRAVDAASPRPVIALGGIKIQNVNEVSKSGVIGIAGIGLFEFGAVSDTVESIRREFR
jgi:thiamine-phosphate pyrophosphorylase